MTEVIEQRSAFIGVMALDTSGGLGLGLAIAQHVCQLQGSMQITSQLEQGTIVTLFLPIASLKQ